MTPGQIKNVLDQAPTSFGTTDAYVLPNGNHLVRLGSIDFYAAHKRNGERLIVCESFGLALDTGLTGATS